MTPIEEIKSRLDIIDIVSETVQLRKSGRSYSGLCPFHSNTKTPSFVVFPHSQTWRCFGACADGGDIFSYTMKKNGWDFKEALENLARKAGVQLEQASPAQKAKKAAADHIIDLLESAAGYFHQLFLHAPQAAEARRYVDGRGLTEETIETYSIGFALDAWDACRGHFMGQGYTEEDLLKAGLLTENQDRGTRYDRFRNRLMIPIRDVSGRVVGFGARTLDPDGIPKYLNSPQTDHFDKSHLLYGLDLAKRHIREARQAVIVEGYMDVIQAWQGGFRNVVAQMGTALTPQQLQLLKRYTKRFVIALDADEAGVKATMRSLEVARKTLDRETEFRFDPSGLVKQEGRLEADIRIVTIPVGEDPDSIIRHDPISWVTLIDEAKPVVEYVIGVLAEAADTSDAKSKSALAKQVIPLITDVKDPVEREHYWQLLARTLRVDDRALKQLDVPTKQKRQSRPAVDNNNNRQSGPPTQQNGRHKKRFRSKPKGQFTQPKFTPPPLPDGMPDIPPPDFFDGDMGGMLDMGDIPADPFTQPPVIKEQAPIGRTQQSGIQKRENYFLRTCLQDPLLIRLINRKLSEQGQPVAHVEDFTRPDDQALFLLLHQQQSVGHVVSIDEMWDSLDLFLQQRVQILQLEPPADTDVSRDRLSDQLTLTILDLRLDNANRLNNELKVLIREAKYQANQAQMQNYVVQHANLTRTIRQLNQAKGAMSAVSRRRMESQQNRKTGGA